MGELSADIRNLVAADKLEQALQALSGYLGDKDVDLSNELIALQANLTKSKKTSRRHLITQEEEDRSRAKIRFAILDLLQEVEKIQEESKSSMVFISYNHEDSDIARKLREALKEHGIDVWIDSETMQPGEDIKSFIERSILATDVTLSVVSNKSLLSAWVAMETIDTFYHGKFKEDKRFIACYIDDDFFKAQFRLEATQKIDAKIAEIDQLIPQYIEQKIDTNDLNSEKSRLFELRNNLGTILMRLKGSLSLDVREDQFEQSLKRLVNTLREPSSIA